MRCSIVANRRQVFVELALGPTGRDRPRAARYVRRRDRGCCADTAGGVRARQGRGWYRCRRTSARTPDVDSFPAASASPDRATRGCWCRRTSNPNRSCRPYANRRSRARAIANRVCDPICMRGHLIDGDPVLNVGARGLARVDAGQVCGGGAGVIARTIAERVAVPLRQARQHHGVGAELLERFQHARVLERRARGLRRPVGHRDAVRHVGERHAERRLAHHALIGAAAKAGVIASSIGSATTAPMPRRNVRRGRCLPRHDHDPLLLPVCPVVDAAVGPLSSVSTGRRDWNGRLLTISITRPENR